MISKLQSRELASIHTAAVISLFALSCYLLQKTMVMGRRQAAHKECGCPQFPIGLKHSLNDQYEVRDINDAIGIHITVRKLQVSRGSQTQNQLCRNQYIGRISQNGGLISIYILRLTLHHGAYSTDIP